MECGTIYCDPDDMCTVLRTCTPTAMQPHKCDECRREIRKGEQYLREVTLFDGKVETWKTCIDCESIRKNFFKEGFFYGEIKAMLHDYVRDGNGDVPESCLTSLTYGARNMVCAMIEEEWEDAFDMEDEG